MSGDTYLITGASGRTGGAAIDELLKMGRKVRAYLRTDGVVAAQLRGRGVEIAFGDYENIDQIRAAMDGIAGAYFLHPIAPGIIGATAYFAQAAKEAGVRSIVNMSQISARREATSHAARDHWISERVFDGSGVATTHLRPTFFADRLIYPHVAKEIWATKKITFPYGLGRHAPIYSEDQGRVIAHLLSKPHGHEGRVYPLHGPVEMDHHEIAIEIGRVLDVEISYEPLSIPEYKDKLANAYKFHSFLVQHLGEVAQDCQDGVFAGTNDVVEKVTGVPALTVAEVVERNRALFA